MRHSAIFIKSLLISWEFGVFVLSLIFCLYFSSSLWILFRAFYFTKDSLLFGFPFQKALGRYSCAMILCFRFVSLPARQYVVCLHHKKENMMSKILNFFHPYKFHFIFREKLNIFHPYYECAMDEWNLFPTKGNILFFRR